VQKAVALVPTPLHHLVVGKLDLHLSTTQACQEFLGVWQRHGLSAGGYTIIIAPITITHEEKTHKSTIHFYHERYNEYDVLQYPHEYRIQDD